METENSYHPIKMSDLNTRFTTNLSAFGITQKQLNEFLFNTNAFVAGGFVSAAVLGTDLTPAHDLDIWINHTTHNLEKYYEVSLEERLLNAYIPLAMKEWGYELVENTGERDREHIIDHLEKGITMVVTYQNKMLNRNIQIICRNKMSVVETISSFDLDICKFTYFASGGFTSHLTNEQLIRISKEKEMRVCTVGIRSPIKLLERIRKYGDRGFHLVHHENGEPILNYGDYILSLFPSTTLTRKMFMATRAGMELAPEVDMEENIRIIMNSRETYMPKTNMLLQEESIISESESEIESEIESESEIELDSELEIELDIQKKVVASAAAGGK